MNSHEYRWGLLWRSDNRLDGHTEHLLRHWRTYDPGLVNNPLLFRTRRQARAYRDEHFGYIRNRPDLKAEPHEWKLPKVVKVFPKYPYINN